MIWRLPIIVSLVTMALAWAPPAQGQDAFTCVDGLNRYLYLDIKTALRLNAEKPNAAALLISDTKPISGRLATDSRFLARRFEEKIVNLAEPAKQTCRKLAAQIYPAYLDFYERRLTRLLLVGDVQTYYTEANILEAAWAMEPSSSGPRAIVAQLQPRYLETVTKRLYSMLENTRWGHFAQIPVQLQSWNAEWINLMRREAPAAVDLGAGRVALRPLDYDPQTLTFFLFHEIAHFDDWTNGHSSDPDLARLQNELAAWRETLAFVDLLEERHEQIPTLFSNIKKAVAVWGLEPWVHTVLMRIGR